MFNLFFRKNPVLVLCSLALFGCSNNETNAKVSKKNINVIDCKMDFDDVDFCKNTYMDSYLNIINNNKFNFDKDKNIFNFEYNGNQYLSIVDVSDKKVYTFPAFLKIKEKSFLKYSLNSNVFCLRGDFNQFQNSYRNVETCFKFIDGNFHLESRINLIDNKLKKVKTIKLPNNSNFYSECRNKNTEAECKKQSLLNDYSYSEDGINEVFKELKIDVNVKKLNADTFRFISHYKNVAYIIAEKYIVNDEGASSEFFLINIVGKNKGKILDLGHSYSIDKTGLLEYGLNKKIKLF